jgi:hypothetical protein
MSVKESGTACRNLNMEGRAATLGRGAILGRGAVFTMLLRRVLPGGSPGGA